MMKVWFKVLHISLFSLLVLYGVPTFAQENVPGELYCPRIELIDSLSRNSCESSTKDGEAGIPSIMLEEIEYFQEDVITNVLADNQKDLDFLARKSVWNLRQHKKCLFEFCEAYLSVCPQTLTKSSSFVDQKNWCDNTVNEALRLQQINVGVHLQINQKRKQNDTEHQKLGGFFLRFKSFVEEPFVRVLEGFEHIKTSITGLVKNPTRP